jgi:hypothetical protein
MSSTTELEKMLRDAIAKAKEATPRASDDLYRCSSAIAEVVDRVTTGSVKLELVELNQIEGAPHAYQLQLHKVGSESPASDLGIYFLTPDGYPIQRWLSRRKWEAHPHEPNGTYSSMVELEGHFQWMISNPESRLVTLITFLQPQLSPSSSNGSKTRDSQSAKKKPK